MGFTPSVRLGLVVAMVFLLVGARLDVNVAPQGGSCPFSGHYYPAPSHADDGHMCGDHGRRHHHGNHDHHDGDLRSHRAKLSEELAEEEDLRLYGFGSRFDHDREHDHHHHGYRHSGGSSLSGFRGEIREEVGRLMVAREEDVRVFSERVGEIGRVLDGANAREAVGERNVSVVELGELVDKLRCLTDKLEGVSEARMRLGETLEVVKRENEKLRWEKVESDQVVKGLTKEKEVVAEELVELGREVTQLRGRVKDLERVNEEIGREKEGNEDEITELEKEFARLSEIMTSLQKEERKLQSRLLELESIQDAVLEKVKEREREIGALVKVTEAKEGEALRLKEGYDSSEKKLRMVAFINCFITVVLESFQKPQHSVEHSKQD